MSEDENSSASYGNQYEEVEFHISYQSVEEYQHQKIQFPAVLKMTV
jgi:hypothetical protein